MSEFESFGGSVPFKASFDVNAMGRAMGDGLSTQWSLAIFLTDDNEWLEHKVESFNEIIVRYHGKEHHFTPDEVLRALYAARDEVDA